MKRIFPFLLMFALCSCNHTEIGYYPNGQKRYEQHFKGSKLNGLWEAWTEKGHLSMHFNYVIGKEDGLCIMYNDTTGLPFYKKYYRMGILDSELDFYKDKKFMSSHYFYPAPDSEKIIYKRWNKKGWISGEMITDYLIKNEEHITLHQCELTYDSVGNKTTTTDEYFKEGKKIKQRDAYRRYDSVKGRYELKVTDTVVY